MPYSDREQYRAYQAAYRAARREANRAYQREYRAKNADRLREYERQRGSELARLALQRAIYWTKRQDRSTHKRAYYQVNGQTVRQAATRWRRANPEKFSAYRLIYKARRRGAPVSDLTRAQWERIKAAFGFRCVYCGDSPERLTQDHVAPLSKGGHHTALNVVPACMTCNRRKQAGPVLPMAVIPRWVA